MMSRFATLAVLLTSALSVVATPVAEPAPVAIEKRSYSGRATFFYVGLGNCGHTNVDSDYIVALATKTYAGGKHCGKKVKITDTSNGKTATATVMDSCPGCGSGDLDMSPGLFKHFENEDKGVFPIKWTFL